MDQHFDRPDRPRFAAQGPRRRTPAAAARFCPARSVRPADRVVAVVLAVRLGGIARRGHADVAERAVGLARLAAARQHRDARGGVRL